MERISSPFESVLFAKNDEVIVLMILSWLKKIVHSRETPALSMPCLLLWLFASLSINDVSIWE